MQWSVVAVLVVVCCSVVLADHPPVPITGPQKDGCTKYMLEGHGDFKLHKKLYLVRTPDYFIKSLRLVRRTSFYKCTPSEVKYGVDVDGRTWWVDKGCTGVFEITECPETSRPQGAEPANSGVYSNMFNVPDTATSGVDVHSLDFGNVETRFSNFVPLNKINQRIFLRNV